MNGDRLPRGRLSFSGLRVKNIQEVALRCRPPTRHLVLHKVRYGVTYASGGVTPVARDKGAFVGSA